MATNTNPFSQLAAEERELLQGCGKNSEDDRIVQTKPPDQIQIQNQDSIDHDDYINVVDNYAAYDTDQDSSDSSNEENEVLPLLDTNLVKSNLLDSQQVNGTMNTVKPAQNPILKSSMRTEAKLLDNAHTNTDNLNAIGPVLLNKSNINQTENSVLRPPAPHIDQIPSIIEQEIPIYPIEEHISYVERPPMTPIRPPVLPKRRSNSTNSIKKVSNLDPGSTSTVSFHSFYGDRISSNSNLNHDNINHNASFISNEPNGSPALPQRPRLPEYSPSLPNRSISSKNSNLFLNVLLNESHNSDSDLTPIASTPILDGVNNDLLSPLDNIPNFNSFSFPPPVNFSKNYSLPIITVTDGATNPPPLPKKPTLLKKPSISSANSQSDLSAYELLENYNVREGRSSLSTNNLSDIGIDIESLKNLGIDEETIQQQRELEEQFERENRAEQERRNKLLQQERSNEFTDTFHGNNNNTITNGNSITHNDTAHGDNEESENDFIDSVSQLEIPTNLSRTQSALSVDDISDIQSVGTSVSSVDIFANGDLTEKEFIGLLPPVPKYTETPSETELSIPNGKAINIMLNNENHPNEKPPEYTPVPETLRKIINRPQFSQTGGDAGSYRRQQQQLERERRYEQQLQRRQQQLHLHGQGQLQSQSPSQSQSQSQPQQNQQNRKPVRRLPPLRRSSTSSYRF
jgi:hypothetical protein